MARPITEPPLYAARGTTGIVALFGALSVNERAQVLNRGGRPIRSLYATGVDVGGFPSIKKSVYCEFVPGRFPWIHQWDAQG